MKKTLKSFALVLVWIFGFTFFVSDKNWLATGRWFSLGTANSSTNETDCHNTTEILLKVALNTINHQNKYLLWPSKRTMNHVSHMMDGCFMTIQENHEPCVTYDGWLLYDHPREPWTMCHIWWMVTLWPSKRTMNHVSHMMDGCLIQVKIIRQVLLNTGHQVITKAILYNYIIILKIVITKHGECNVRNTIIV